MEFAIFWIGFTILIGVLAAKRDRSVVGWVVCSLIFSPLVAGLFLLVLGSAAPTATAQAYSEAPTPDTHVRCPDCRELVRKDARKCKHCGTTLTPQ